MAHLIIKNAVDEPSKGKNAKKVGDFEFRAIWSAFNDAVNTKLARGGKRLYKRGKDFPHCCDVLIRRSADKGNYYAEVK